MARLKPETVQQLIDLLRLPLGEHEEDPRPHSTRDDVERVSRAFGLLLFKDESWFTYDVRRIADTLAVWVDDVTAPRFELVAGETHPHDPHHVQRFLDWVEHLVRGWTSGAIGHGGDDTAAPGGLLQGYEYADSVLPGTEYYREDGDTYLYGPKEFGAAHEWQPYEHWQELATKEQEGLT